MEIHRLNESSNKINTREELTYLLNSCKGILTNLMYIDYLTSLIELDFSVIRDNISNNDRLVLSELEVYKRIAIFNIYNRALNIFKQHEPELRISGNEDGLDVLGVSTSLGNRCIELFDFNYREGFIGFQNNIPEGYKTMKIGEISLFQTIGSEELREAEFMWIISTLNKLHNEQNPYPTCGGVQVGIGLTWDFNHATRIKELEERFRQLDCKKELNDNEKREIEITKQFHDLLLEDYGLTDESFVDESDQFFTGCYDTKLQKTRVKRMPNLNIYDNIHYV